MATTIVTVICELIIVLVIASRFKAIERILELHDKMHTLLQLQVDLLDAEMTGNEIKKRRVKKDFLEFQNEVQYHMTQNNKE